jgi:hypothetical protein
VESVPQDIELGYRLQLPAYLSMKKDRVNTKTIPISSPIIMRRVRVSVFLPVGVVKRVKSSYVVNPINDNGK